MNGSGGKKLGDDSTREPPAAEPDRFIPGGTGCVGESGKDSELLSPYEQPAHVLRDAPYDKLMNCEAKRTWGATGIGLIGLAAYITWMVVVCRGYLRYLEGKGPLPVTGLVEVGIPIFFATMGVEIILSFRYKAEIYRFNDTACSLGSGILQTLMDSVVFGLLGEWLGVVFITAIPYKLLHDNFKICSFSGLWGFIGMVFANDFAFFWFHYATHRISFLWTLHGVHHRPSEYNYSINFCQGALLRVGATMFYGVLVFFFPPELYILIWPMRKMYGFMVHTRLVNNMYFIDWIFITPALHRVHHASGPSIYKHKNYGEVFSIWDRMMGTYQDELPNMPICYGFSDTHTSWDPIIAQAEWWAKIFARAKPINSTFGKVLQFFRPPGWNAQSKSEVSDPDLNIYRDVKIIPKPVIVQTLGFVVLSVSSIGRILDRNTTTIYVEGLRLAILPSTFQQICFSLPMVRSTLDKGLVGIGLPKTIALVGFLPPITVLFAFFVMISAVSYGFLLFHRAKFDGKKEFIPYAGRWFKDALDREMEHNKEN